MDPDRIIRLDGEGRAVEEIYDAFRHAVTEDKDIRLYFGEREGRPFFQIKVGGHIWSLPYYSDPSS